MDHIAAAEERLVNERMRQKLNEVNSAAQSHLSGVQDHINFTLQQAYFRCAYECFDRRKKNDEISNCVENCSVPVLTAQNLVENEMAKFQNLKHADVIFRKILVYSRGDNIEKERLSRSLTVCQDKYEAAKIHPNKNFATKDLESCVELSIQDNINLLPHVAAKLKARLLIKD